MLFDVSGYSWASRPKIEEHKLEHLDINPVYVDGSRVRHNEVFLIRIHVSQLRSQKH
jgi:hypothetical protein